MQLCRIQWCSVGVGVVLWVTVWFCGGTVWFFGVQCGSVEVIRFEVYTVAWLCGVMFLCVVLWSTMLYVMVLWGTVCFSGVQCDTII